MEILAQLWSFLGLLTVLQNVLPTQLLSFLQSWWESLQDHINPYSYLEIPEFNGCFGVDVNDLYRHVHLYLSTLNSSSPRRTMLTLPKNSCCITAMVAPNHTLEDSFRGHCVWWTHHVETVQDSLEERRSFCLKLHHSQRDVVLKDYLAEVTAKAKEFECVSRERRLFTNNGHGVCELGWGSVPFHHPATFETLALEPELRESVIADLKAFANGREFYHRVGRAWKRGYLLYGPPGTGKSSLIAAMANFLHYDVYDLELTKVVDNSELRTLLIQTTNKSIIVIEDIDCSLDLTERLLSKQRRSFDVVGRKGGDHASIGEESRVTLSGLLNFTDGLWSCCGEERIIVFTTNHKESIDAALLRCGRMDVHIMLSTCGPNAFRVLVRNYLGLHEHELFCVVDQFIEAGGRLTPAEVGEILIKNKGDVNVAVKSVIAALQMSMKRESCMCKPEKFEDDQLVQSTGKKKAWRWQKKMKCIARMKMVMQTTTTNKMK